MRHCLLLLSMLFAVSAKAYVLPAEVILKNFVQQSTDSTLRDLSIRLSTDKEGEKQLYFKAEKFRLDKADATFITKELNQPSPPERFLGFLWFTEGGNANEKAQNLLQRLNTLGIDTEITSLGYLDHQVVYIIGAKSFENQKPQVSFTKDRFNVVRFVQHGVLNKQTALYDTRVFYDAAFKYPARFEIYQDNELQEHSTVTKIQKNQNLSDALFIPKT